VEQNGTARRARAVIVEPRMRARIDRRIGGIARDERANSGARLRERYMRSSRRMRA
jgi:hypothetical protein